MRSCRLASEAPRRCRAGCAPRLYGATEPGPTGLRGTWVLPDPCKMMFWPIVLDHPVVEIEIGVVNERSVCVSARFEHPDVGVKATRLRVRLDELVRWTVEHQAFIADSLRLDGHGPIRAYGDPQRTAQLRRGKVGRPRLTEDELRRDAQVFLHAERAGMSGREAVAGLHNFTPYAADKRIRFARDAGLLPPVTRRRV